MTTPRQKKQQAVDIPQHLTDNSALGGKKRQGGNIYNAKKKKKKAANPHLKDKISMQM